MNEMRWPDFHEALRRALEEPNTVDEICLLGGWLNPFAALRQETLRNKGRERQQDGCPDPDDLALRAWVNRMNEEESTSEARIARCRREIAAIEVQIRSGHRDLLGLCRALLDWNAELRLLEKGMRADNDAIRPSFPGASQEDS
jgi:hypothetical protein